MDINTSPEETEPKTAVVPRTLGRKSQAVDDMLKRVLPEAVPDGGVAQLDVCAFNSSI